MNKLISTIKKFGFKYLIIYTLFKLKVLKDDTRLLLLKQTYYKSLDQTEIEKSLCTWFYEHTGKKLNLNNVSSFNEKMQYLKLYDNSELKTIFADKYLAPQKVKEICGDKIKIIPCLGVYTNAKEIDYSTLPEKFVLKCNHGSGMNIIVKNKQTLNKKNVAKKLNNWLKINYAYRNGAFEMQYKDIPPRIIAEEYIEEVDGNLHDYKIHCFNGEPKYIQVIGNRNLETHTALECYFDTAWNKMNFTDVFPMYQKDIEKPFKLNEMIEVAKKLSQNFKYVRVDLYIIRDAIYFGELTFTSGNGIYKWSPETADIEVGKLIKL